MGYQKKLMILRMGLYIHMGDCSSDLHCFRLIERNVKMTLSRHEKSDIKVDNPCIRPSENYLRVGMFYIIALMFARDIEYSLALLRYRSFI